VLECEKDMTRATILLVTVVAANTASAQLIEAIPKSKATGPMVSAAGQLARYQPERAPRAQSGSGATATIGYGFNQTIAAVMTGSTAVINYDSGGGFTVDQIGVGVRVHMANSHWRWVPFLEVVAGPRWIVDEDFTLCGVSACQQGPLERSGVGYAQSLGLSFYPARRFALSLAGHMNASDMTKARFNGQETLGIEDSAQDLRLSFGGTWFLGGGSR
jgi:hypothetical protein